MHLRHAILHKVAEDPKPAKKLDPRVQAWLDNKKKAGEQVYMGEQSILNMIKADKAIKDLGSERAALVKRMSDPNATDVQRAALSAKLAKVNKQLGVHRKTVDSFNNNRELRKKHNITPEMARQERQHMKGAVKAQTDAFVKTLEDAGYGGALEGGKLFHDIPEDVRQKAEQAATAAGTDYVKGRLGFLSDDTAEQIQRYSQYRLAGGDANRQIDFDDPEYRRKVGLMGLSFQASQDPQLAKKLQQGALAGAAAPVARGVGSVLGTVSEKVPVLGNFLGDTQQKLEQAAGAAREGAQQFENRFDTGYRGVIDRMGSGYLDATKNMSDRYSQERTAQIKKWAPWVIGGGALLTGALSMFGGDDKKEAPKDAWTQAQQADPMAWTTDAFRSANRNPGRIAQAPRSPFSGAFRSFMSQNPFGRA